MLICVQFDWIPDIQQWIGYQEILASPTYFYVQKNANFSQVGPNIPFEVEILNIGNAFDLTSGVFTAPKAGKYFFSFSGVVYFPQNEFRSVFEVTLHLNYQYIASSFSDEPSGSYGAYKMIGLQSIYQLNRGDQVYLSITFGGKPQLYNDNYFRYPNTHFTGWLLQEDIF